LLAFSRRQIPAPVVLSLNSVVGGIEKMLRRLIGEDLALHIRLAEDLGSVRADPAQLEQVVMNLVLNARDAMPRGGTLDVETSNVELDAVYAGSHVDVKPGSYVLVAVSDTGCGMDQKTLSRIFEPFFTTKLPGKGTGLGLATSYGIVKQSGGHIGVYSEVGRGSTFRIYLPREAAKAEAAEVKRPPVHAGGDETVLVVEDDDGVRRLVRRVLEPAGYTVLSAATGPEALQLCEERADPVHLLLTDVVLPVMDGSTVAERLTALRPGVRVLFMSGYMDEAVGRHGVPVTGLNFIHKPFTASELLGRVREALDRDPARAEQPAP
jgi:two-component system, cell cycle sensor histidine kinase and response regulator CckA